MIVNRSLTGIIENYILYMYDITDNMCIQFSVLTLFKSDNLISI